MWRLNNFGKIVQKNILNQECLAKKKNLYSHYYKLDFNQIRSTYTYDMFMKQGTQV